MFECTRVERFNKVNSIMFKMSSSIAEEKGRHFMENDGKGTRYVICNKNENFRYVRLAPPILKAPRRDDTDPQV